MRTKYVKAGAVGIGTLLFSFATAWIFLVSDPFEGTAMLLYLIGTTQRQAVSAGASMNRVLPEMPQWRVSDESGLDDQRWRVRTQVARRARRTCRSSKR